jgi:2-oxoglutarate ferredoxin oxidoreductase subunit gamma
LVSEPDAAIIMNLPSLYKFMPTIKPGGLLIYNSSLIDEKPSREDVKVIAIPCNEIAAEVGNSRTANMVMLGAYNALTHIVNTDSLLEALRKTLGKAKEHLIPINQKAMEAGAEAAGK